jgi:signal transduction histidine kinase
MMRDPLILLVESDSHGDEELRAGLETGEFRLDVTKESDAVARVTTPSDDPVDLVFISKDAGGHRTALALWDVAPHVEVVICVASIDDLLPAPRSDQTRRFLIARHPLSSPELVQMARAQLLIRHLSRSAAREPSDDHPYRMKIVSDLAAGLAHEINTPIQYLGDSVEHLATLQRRLLQSVRLQEAPVLDGRRQAKEDVDDLDQMEEDGIRSLLRLRRGHHRIAEVIRGLQTFAHPPYGSLTIDINEELRRTLAVAESIYRPFADVCLDLADPHTVCCASRDLRYLFLQILSNAADAIRHSRGLQRGRIQIQTRYCEGWARVSFRDNSTAISPTVMASANLAICRDIASRNGADISVHSEPGLGSTFNIQVPMEVAS